MKVHFKLNLSKVDSDGYAPVVMHVLWKSYKFQHYTTERILPKYWNESEQKVRRSHSAAAEINNYLDALNEKVKSLYRGYLANGIIPTPSLLKNDLIPSNSVELKKDINSFTSVYSRFLDYLTKLGRHENTLKYYRKILHHFQGWFKVHGEISVDEFTDEKYLDFVCYMKSVYSYHPNTISAWAKDLKVFFKWCAKNKIKLNENHVELKRKYVETDRTFLEMDEILNMMYTVLPERLTKIRDVFVFSCLTGLRYGDFSKIKSEQIVSIDGAYYLNLINDKTLCTSSDIKKQAVPLIDLSLYILDKYDNVLPVYSNQKMNQHLKELGLVCQLNTLVQKVEYINNTPTIVFVPKRELITCHVARHTFATLSLMNGIDIAVVSKLLGHKKLETTMIYTHVLDKYKTSEVKKAFGKLQLN